MRTLLNMLRAKATMIVLSKGVKIKDLKIESIPETWTAFPHSKDKWVKVDIPKEEKMSSCFYFGKKGSVFLPHIHKKNDEHFMIVNKNGKIEIITNNYIEQKSFPESCYVPKNVAHAIKFLEDTKIFIMWHPNFINGWEGEFQMKK